MRRLDYPIKFVCNHLFGETHSHTHRMGVGVVLVVTGVTVAKIHTDSFILHLVVDSVGYGIHGLGVTPFLAHFENMGKAEKVNVESEVESEVESNVEVESEVEVEN